MRRTHWRTVREKEKLRPERSGQQVAVNRLKKINLRMRPLFWFLGITLKGFRGIPTALPLVTRLAPKERQSKRGDDQMRVMKAFLPVLLVLASATAAEAQAQVKFGFINSQIIIEQDSAAQAAQRQFDADLARYQAEITQLARRGSSLLPQYQQQQAMLSAEARANREEEIRLKQAAVRSAAPGAGSAGWRPQGGAASAGHGSYQRCHRGLSGRGRLRGDLRHHRAERHCIGSGSWI